MVEMPEVQRNIFERTHTYRTYARAAFIGTRRVDEVSSLCHGVYLDMVERAVAAGYTIRTGAAQGADQIAAMRALHLGGHVELVLPYVSYENEWIRTLATDYELPGQVFVEVYDPLVHTTWRDAVSSHPKVHSYHARNYGIIEPSEVVVALCAPDRKGGTEQGIRIAMGLGKRCVVLESGNRSRRMGVGPDDDTLAGVPGGISFQSLGPAKEPA